MLLVLNQVLSIVLWDIYVLKTDQINKMEKW